TTLAPEVPAAVAPDVVPVDTEIAAPIPAPVAGAPSAGAAKAGGVEQLARGGTLVLRRVARLLAGANSQSQAVAELKTGMLLFPTGSTEGSMLEVEDEMGNKGWVPAAAVESA
ncbi:MAG: hypothetical protein ACN6O2_04185, partial [Stenotrophomonas sp.]